MSSLRQDTLCSLAAIDEAIPYIVCSPVDKTVRNLSFSAFELDGPLGPLTFPRRCANLDWWGLARFRMCLSLNVVAPTVIFHGLGRYISEIHHLLCELLGRFANDNFVVVFKRRFLRCHEFITVKCG